METIKKIKDLLIQKQDYINSQRDNLEKSVLDLQDKLLSAVIGDIISELDTKDGIILNTAHNFRILNQLDNVYLQFSALAQTKVIEQIARGTIGINGFNLDYFKAVTIDDITSERFDKIVAKTDKLMAERIGMTTDGEIKTGGFLDSFISDNRLATEVKQLTARGITGGMNITDVRNMLKDKIVGTEDYTGGFERYYRQYAYDTFQEYDRAYSKNMADEFAMNYALYQGGLIRDSRDFCRDHNDHVYVRDEIEQFGHWTYESAQNISEFHDGKNPSGIPSYIENYPGYDPFVSCGGFNCRHSLGWITQSMSFRLRPELAEL